MKKFFKILFVGIILSVVIVFFSYRMYRSSAVANLTEKDKAIERKWELFIISINKRDSLIVNNIMPLDFQKDLKDSLFLSIKSRFENVDTIYKTNNFKSFIINEYDINRFVIKFLDLTDFKDEKLIRLKDEVDSISSQCNIAINDYNSKVKEFNSYRSSFPNSFIARSLKIRNIKFYDLKYGTENKNPKEKSNIEKWIETGDPIYLNKE